MTDTISAPRMAPEAATSTDGLVWLLAEEVQPPVWIGRYRGVSIGIIEHSAIHGFTATTQRGRGLGSFGTLEEAQSAFYSH